MPIVIQNPITGSDATFVKTGSKIALDVDIHNVVPISGIVTVQNITGSIVIGSVSASVDSIYVQSGTMFISSGNVATIEEIPTATNKNNPSWKFDWLSSGTAVGVTGSRIGSIYQYIGTGSYSQSLTYVNDVVTQTSAWVTI